MHYNSTCKHLHRGLCRLRDADIFSKAFEIGAALNTCILRDEAILVGDWFEARLTYDAPVVAITRLGYVSHTRYRDPRIALLSNVEEIQCSNQRSFYIDASSGKMLHFTPYGLIVSMMREAGAEIAPSIVALIIDIFSMRNCAPEEAPAALKITIPIGKSTTITAFETKTNVRKKPPRDSAGPPPHAADSAMGKAASMFEADFKSLLSDDAKRSRCSSSVSITAESAVKRLPKPAPSLPTSLFGLGVEVPSSESSTDDDNWEQVDHNHEFNKLIKAGKILKVARLHPNTPLRKLPPESRPLIAPQPNKAAPTVLTASTLHHSTLRRIVGTWWLTRTNRSATCATCAQSILPQACRLVFCVKPDAALARKAPSYVRMHNKIAWKYYHVFADCLPHSTEVSEVTCADDLVVDLARLPKSYRETYAHYVNFLVDITSHALAAFRDRGHNVSDA